MFEVLYDWRLRLQRKAAIIRAKYPQRRSDGPERQCPQVRAQHGAVKGVARRVVIVKTPDPKIFEEAIFVVREEFLSKNGVSAADLLREAKTAADGYIETTIGRPPRNAYSWLPAAAYVAAGSVLTALVWLAVNYFAIV